MCRVFDRALTIEGFDTFYRYPVVVRHVLNSPRKAWRDGLMAKRLSFDANVLYFLYIAIS